MPEQKVFRPFKGVAAMAGANFDAWIRSPRVWVTALCVVVYCLLQAINSPAEHQVNGLSPAFTLPEMLFLRMTEGFFIMASLLFLVMVSELPRRINYQYSMLMRASRGRWLLSQALYCLWMAAAMVAALVILYCLFALPYAAPGGGWAEDVLIQAEAYAEYEALVPTYIRQGFSPWGACLLAAGPMFLFWFVMALVILLFSLLGAPMLGPLFYGTALFAPVTILVEAFQNGFPSPINYSTLSNIVYRFRGEEIARLWQVGLYYLVAIALLLGALYLSAKRADLTFYAGNRE
ncbi:MAG: hypothetical protein QMB53_02010 [Eubacteriales bacterium]